jgi:hypothetical protein
MSVIPEPDPNYANKALVSAVGTVVLVLLRWAVSGEFQYTDEGLITLAGAITTLAVYAVSNFRRLLGVSQREAGYGVVELLGPLVLLLLLVIWLVFALDAAVAAFRSSWG